MPRNKNLESGFQDRIRKKILNEYPDALCFKMEKQGIPDLLFLHKNTWFALECKRDLKSKHRPNQDYYVDKLNSMSYAAFVYPENEEEILNDIRKAFKP